MRGYTAKQLLAYYQFCKTANPKSRVLPPGGRHHWDDMTAADWLDWLRSRLMEKINRTLPMCGRKQTDDYQRDLLLDARLIREHLNTRLRRHGSGLLRTKEMQSRYPHVNRCGMDD